MSFLITCPSCGKEVEVPGPGKYACFFCGQSLDVAQSTAASDELGHSQITTGLKCPECLGEVPTGARRCMHCGSKLTGHVSKPFGGDKVPPWATLALGLLCITGLSQMLMGQLGKGLAILFAAVGIGFLTAGAGWLIVHVLVAIDAFMVANALRTGLTVGKWEFFPH